MRRALSRPGKPREAAGRHLESRADRDDVVDRGWHRPRETEAEHRLDFSRWISRAPDERADARWCQRQTPGPYRAGCRNPKAYGALGQAQPWRAHSPHASDVFHKLDPGTVTREVERLAA